MTDLTGPELERATVTDSFVGLVARTEGVGAILLCLLPVPAAAFELLPSYEAHSRFLIFYAPTICLLTLGYLVYVRDTLARLLFRNAICPQPEIDPYYARSLSDVSRRAWTRVRTMVLTLIPLLLAAASFYCLTHYIARLEQSVTVSGQVMFDRMPVAQQSEFVRSPKTTAPTAPPGLSVGGDTVSAATAARVGVVDSLAGAVDEIALRRYTLRAANLGDIAFFNELTVLYIGTFACMLAAFMFMILKEHARRVLGVSEEGLIVDYEPQQ